VKPLQIESQRDLLPILGGPALHRASLYVPFERAPVGLHASQLRLRAGLDRAAARLRERGVAEDHIQARWELLTAVEPELRSLDPAARTLVWLGDERGWAFAALPEPLAERVAVAHHYALRPLLGALQRERRFRLIAVSAKRVAIYEGDAARLRPIEVEGIPGSLEEALGSQVEGGDLSFRSEQPVPGQRSQAPIYHGHGGAADERALDRERFHRVLGPAISAAWRTSEVPLVLAAEVRTASELRKHLELPGLLDEEVRGNPDHASAEELHAGAWPIVRAALEQREQQLARRFDAARKVAKTSEAEFDGVAEAAVAGRIRRLWVDETARVPGHLDEMRACRVAAEDPEEDALDALVAVVLQRAGEVHVVGPGETPTGGAFCAELR
jgi:hypothetical protein